LHLEQSPARLRFCSLGNHRPFDTRFLVLSLARSPAYTYFTPQFFTASILRPHRALYTRALFLVGLIGVAPQRPAKFASIR
ncbi:hypothetical protein B0T16DRAFT_437085, partial [Cercophora newfieldiana]